MLSVFYTKARAREHALSAVVQGLLLVTCCLAFGCDTLSETPQVAVPQPVDNVPSPGEDANPDLDPSADLDMGMMPADQGGDTQDMAQPEPVRQPGRRAWHVGQSVQGRPMIAELYGDRGPVLFLLAAIHGSERSAVTFGEQVRTTLLTGLAEREGLQIVFVGAANPDGIAARTRHNARDIDLNRNFDAMSFGMGTHAGGDTPLSEPETVVLTEIVERVAPSAVVSVHCCIPTMDYDGPGRTLAQQMSQAANDKLKVLHGGATSGYRTFPAEKLGASPGSMGSYVGVDLKIPIITLEFASNHFTRTEYQLESIHEAIIAAAAWTAANGQATSIDIAKELAQLELANNGSAYGSDAQRATSSLHTLRVDHWGDMGEAPVLILSGARQNKVAALHVAEHIRSVVLREAEKQRLGAVSVVTALNPAGIEEQTSQTILGDRLEDDLTLEMPQSAEAQFLVELVTSRPPKMVILVEDADEASLMGSASDLRYAGVGDTLPDDVRVVTKALEGPLAQWLEAQQIPTLVLGVDGVYGEGDDRREPDFDFRNQQRFSDVVRQLLR